MTAAGRLEQVMCLYESGLLCGCPFVYPIPEEKGYQIHNLDCRAKDRIMELLGVKV